MSEREIKVGSKWRITGCELLVRDNDRCVVADFMDGHGQMEITTEAWHQIATWVSDPVETPKVGSWVEDQDGPRVVVIKNEKDNPFCAIPQYLLHPEKVGAEYRPCEPPPLVKALDVLADTHPGDEFEWRHVQAVMTEWRAIKAKMGVES